MDNDAKIQKYYDGGKMRNYVMYMEQFWALSVDPALDEYHRKAARGLHDHYRRMVLCMGAKEMPPKHKFDNILDVDYMKNMYRRYEESATSGV